MESFVTGWEALGHLGQTQKSETVLIHAAAGGIGSAAVQPLPDVPGKSVKGVLVEYGPGGYSSAHTHAKSALIYATVLEGAILSAVNGGETKTFIAGQNFTELPGDRHDVSANASKTEPAKLLAVFVVDTDDTALTTPRKP
ncbi:cupin domain-containing protein [Agrobacterium tumefaciens]|uniref:cupin domain-containing protein n=1 Tax=Agrobacterium tumefaciens TaxID=358 RepID=UPI001573EDE0|nr:cupin domain-containing protein [Agrobacterium tumefaciens]NTD87612.1 cupin domain-containing protein [Agrobacterium tumefaciens]NTD92683.1 cupin domain-containing protein [Agrobacterium tumefaciens]NTD97106.1 cupin domain-containing protein [Agrobacterium tumefaciens]NTE15013.1 cupin domain-containing protein [Agrobacterium tumefaciens]NTE27102.1 cupin domain-containing protein [Agrobacterium tumefaciens]